VALVPSGKASASASSSVFTAPGTGYWCFASDYSGDGHYNASADTSSGDECFDVTS
jgi:hypothetical protein